MSRSAYDEHYGCSTAWAASGDITLGLPRGPGGVRLHVVTMSGAGYAATLPDARLCRVGDCITVLNNGGDDFDVMANDGSTVVYTKLTDGNAIDALLLSNSTQEGTWVAAEIGSYTLSTPIATGRQKFDITIAGWTDNLVVSDRIGLMGWDEVSPVTVSITVTSGSMIGSTSTALPAFDSGTLPSGSTILLRNYGYIFGAGGNGGGTSAAGNGGIGLQTSCTLTLWNRTGAVSTYGTIAGGGGGGQGAIPNVYIVPGGGGGGGAGSKHGRGGTATAGANNGGDGGTFFGGLGGAGAVINNSTGGTGGNGGNIGTSGSYATIYGVSPPGSNGLGINGTAHVTKVVAGTILGGEA